MGDSDVQNFRKRVSKDLDDEEMDLKVEDGQESLKNRGSVFYQDKTRSASSTTDGSTLRRGSSAESEARPPTGRNNSRHNSLSDSESDAKPKTISSLLRRKNKPSSKDKASARSVSNHNSTLALPDQYLTMSIHSSVQPRKSTQRPLPEAPSCIPTSRLRTLSEQGKYDDASSTGLAYVNRPKSLACENDYVNADVAFSHAQDMKYWPMMQAAEKSPSEDYTRLPPETHDHSDKACGDALCDPPPDDKCYSTGEASKLPKSSKSRHELSTSDASSSVPPRRCKSLMQPPQQPPKQPPKPPPKPKTVGPSDRKKGSNHVSKETTNSLLPSSSTNRPKQLTPPERQQIEKDIVTMAHSNFPVNPSATGYLEALDPSVPVVHTLREECSHSTLCEDDHYESVN